MYRFIIVSLYLLVLMNSCKSQSTSRIESNDSLGLTLILKGDYSGEESEQVKVLNRQDDLERFFGIINRTRKPGLPLPSVNFEKETLIVILKGLSYHNSDNIKSVIVSEDKIVLKKKREKELKSSSALLTPFFIYRINKTNKDVVIQ